MGLKQLIKVNHNEESFLNNKVLIDIVQKYGAFNAVIDPFADLHIGKVTDIMDYNSKYITCGRYNQYPGFSKEKFEYSGKGLHQILGDCVMKNISIIGNCLGTAEDLKHAISDYVDGKFNINIDSIYKCRDFKAFLDRTYNCSDRFGKVVYKYEK